MIAWLRRRAGRPLTADRSDRPAAQRGSVSVEVAILAPAFIALIVFAGFAGRTAIANEAIDAAAHDAARAASISRTANDARTAALRAAQTRLNWEGISCTGQPTVTFAGRVAGRAQSFNAAFTSPLGTDAAVVVTVSCQVSMANLRISILPGMPRTKQVQATFTSPLDRYRSRS